jgi:hypothetical protein
MCGKAVTAVCLLRVADTLQLMSADDGQDRQCVCVSRERVVQF